MWKIIYYFITTWCLLHSKNFFYTIEGNGVGGIGSLARVTKEILFDSARLEHIYFTYQAAELKEKMSLEKSLCILQNFSAITPSHSSLKPQSFLFLSQSHWLTQRTFSQRSRRSPCLRMVVTSSLHWTRHSRLSTPELTTRSVSHLGLNAREISKR